MDCNITTNSLLLTKEKIRLLEQCNISFFQITIDGCREEHNKVKKLPNIDTFSIALNNIVNIVKMLPKAYCILRINLSKRMQDPCKIINQINEIIPIELHNKVKVDLQTVWQEGEEAISIGVLNKMRDFSIESNFATTTFHHGTCYVDFKHFNCIFPNGHVDICDHEGLDKIGRAVLTEFGEIEWTEELQCFKYNIDKENVYCNHCKHVLICGGPCPVSRNQLSPDFFTTQCCEKNMEQKMVQTIKDIYDVHVQKNYV